MPGLAAAELPGLTVLDHTFDSLRAAAQCL
jgi:hypothetical protein